MSSSTSTSETKLGQWDEVYTYFKSVKLKKNTELSTLLKRKSAGMYLAQSSLNMSKLMQEARKQSRAAPRYRVHEDSCTSEK